MARPALDALPRIEPADRAAWRNWLEVNHAASASVWLVLRKKAAGGTLDATGACEEALCFGWIDSLPRKLDAERSMLLVSPRKPGSAWSAVNKGRIERLRAAGLMRPAGVAAIEGAMVDGSWAALDAVETLNALDDLTAAFARHPGAAEKFSAFPPSARRGILEWITIAKRPQTRAARVEETARLAARGERANQWRR